MMCGELPATAVTNASDGSASLTLSTAAVLVLGLGGWNSVAAGLKVEVARCGCFGGSILSDHRGYRFSGVVWSGCRAAILNKGSESYSISSHLILAILLHHQNAAEIYGLVAGVFHRE
jgi:hypothetical protein